MEIRELKLGNQFTAKYLHILLKETVHKPHNRVEWFIFWFDLYTLYLWENRCNLVIPAGLFQLGFCCCCCCFVTDISDKGAVGPNRNFKSVRCYVVFLEAHTFEYAGVLLANAQFPWGLVWIQDNLWGSPKLQFRSEGFQHSLVKKATLVNEGSSYWVCNYKYRSLAWRSVLVLWLAISELVSNLSNTTTSGCSMRDQGVLVRRC